MKDTFTAKTHKHSLVAQNNGTGCDLVTTSESDTHLIPILDARVKKDLERYVYPFRDAGQTASRTAVARGEAAGAVPGGCPMLDTSTPKLGSNESSPSGRRRGRRRVFDKVCRRMYSRVALGFRIPGQYYFITFTTIDTSPPLKRLWDNLRKWLHAYRPGMCWIYCFTSEGTRKRVKPGAKPGQGVIHMVVRLGKGEKRLDAVTVRKYWINLTGARQIVIKHVPESKKEDLASYLANQGEKNKISREFSYQNNDFSSITQWRWSKGWLPRGFTKIFSKMYSQLSSLDNYEKMSHIHNVLIREHEGIVSQTLQNKDVAISNRPPIGPSGPPGTSNMNSPLGWGAPKKALGTPGGVDQSAKGRVDGNIAWCDRHE